MYWKMGKNYERKTLNIKKHSAGKRQNVGEIIKAVSTIPQLAPIV
jgi:hypothetical protein